MEAQTSSIVFVTTNIGKVESATRRLGKHGIGVVHAPLNLPESRGSIEEISDDKARWAYQSIQRPVITMDAGFFIDSLNGFPRQFTNFALETIGLSGILTLVAGKNRRAAFRECLGFYDGRLARRFPGSLTGTIAPKPRGVMKPFLWSTLALIFIPDGFDQTLAELDDEAFTRLREQHDPSSPFEQFVLFWIQYCSTS